jgi:hypothetical protein
MCGSRVFLDELGVSDPDRGWVGRVAARRGDPLLGHHAGNESVTGRKMASLGRY